jgi:FdhD protein
MLLDSDYSGTAGENAVARKGTLPQERLIRIFLNGNLFSYLLCTPVDMKELVIGWLLTQGCIGALNDIDSLKACDSDTDVNVWLRSELALSPSKYHFVASSGCSGGQLNSLRYFKDIKKLESPLTVNIKDLAGLMSGMFRKLATVTNNAGLHCASLTASDDFSNMLLTYDIGRHNAVDKVIGAGLLKDIDFASAILTTSGRISSDMVLKAATAGVPIIVSPKSITTLAVDLASSAGIAAVGRLGRQGRIIAGQVGRIAE